MSLKTNVAALVLSGTVFLGCCIIMLRFGSQMNAKAVVYPFVAVWGVAALAWPLFAIRVVRAVLSRR